MLKIKIRHKHKGAALIMALLLTALAAVVATRIALHQSAAITQNRLIVDYQRGQSALRAAHDQTSIALLRLANLNKIDHKIVRLTPEQSKSETKIFGITVENHIIDTGQFFNINLLNSQNSQNSQIISATNGFRNFLQTQDKTITPDMAQTLITNIKEWIGTNRNDDLEKQYLALHPPIRPAHRPMADISTLRAVLGFTAKRYTTLNPTAQPVLIALPVLSHNNQPIGCNINSVKNMAVLLACGFNEVDAERLISCQPSGPFINANDLKKKCYIQTMPPSAGFTSQFFLLTSCAKMPGQETEPCLQSLLFLDTEKTPLQIDTIWQRLNATMLPTGPTPT